MVTLPWRTEKWRISGLDGIREVLSLTETDTYHHETANACVLHTPPGSKETNNSVVVSTSAYTTRVPGMKMSRKLDVISALGFEFLRVSGFEGG